MTRTTVETPAGNLLASPSRPDKAAFYLSRQQAITAASKIASAHAIPWGRSWVVVIQERST